MKPSLLTRLAQWWCGKRGHNFILLSSHYWTREDGTTYSISINYCPTCGRREALEHERNPQ